jgi:hypothetical protein
MFALDNDIAISPPQLSKNIYVQESRVEENPWRKLFSSGTAGEQTDYYCAERLKSGATYQFLTLEIKNARAKPRVPDSRSSPQRLVSPGNEFTIGGMAKICPQTMRRK